MSNRKNAPRQETAASDGSKAPIACPPCGAAVPEKLPRHKKTPGDRAVDVLDNHTPDIDL